MLKTILNRNVAMKAAVASVAMGVLSAHAENIKVDFGTVDAAPTAANWNTVGFNGSLSNLTDYDTGSVTSAAVSTSGWDQDINNSTNGGHGDWIDDNAADDAVMGFSGVGSITFTGLTATSYAVNLVSMRWGPTDNNIVDITIDGVPGVSNLDGVTSSLDWRTKSAMDNNAWIQWENVAVAGGQLTVDIAFDSGFYTIANAIQIQSLNEIPEPSSAILLGLVGIAALRRRRRLA